MATLPDRFLLELLREQAEGRRQLEEKFAHTLEVADAAGIKIPQLAEAPELTPSHSRPAAKTANAAAPPPPARRRREQRGPRARLRGRDCRRRARRLPRIPPLRRLHLPGGPDLQKRSTLLRLLRRQRGEAGDRRRARPSRQLLFTPETAKQLREQSEAGLANVVEAAVRDGARPPDRPQQLYLLSAPGDARTITLEQPIVHAPSGPGSGFVRGQRYTSLAALKQQPQTTAELLRYEREN